MPKIYVTINFEISIKQSKNLVQDFKLIRLIQLKTILLETRIYQRRKEIDEIRQKSNRFNSNLVHLHSDVDSLLHMIEKSPDVNHFYVYKQIFIVEFLRLSKISFRKLIQHILLYNILVVI